MAITDGRKHLLDIPHTATRNVSAASFHFVHVHTGNITSCVTQGIERVKPSVRGGDLKIKLMNRETYT